ncbi:MAG: hypothetical protein EOP56_03445 [Sphingobacteriales bacterium]|nr:MAG: hypothetical protein EOP56_03445 [Sphingobacteriales bacterium]
MGFRSKILVLCICTLIAIAGGYIVSWSCGPMLTEDQGRFSIFRPDVAVGSSLEPFYYTERFLNSNTPDPAGIDYLRNCEEWRTFTEGKAALNDIYTIQYNTSPDSFVAAYNSKKWDAYKNNSFVQWMLKKSNREALQYMALAKRVEQGQNFNADAWDNPQPKPYRFDSLATFAAQQADTKLPEFLKQRYAFQAVKLWYYTNDSAFDKNLITTYDKHLKGKSIITAHWALVYYAGAQESATERVRYLLQAFDKSEEKKVYAYKNITVQELADFEKENTDTSLVPVVYAMKAIGNSGKALAEIQDVYRYAPNSVYLPLLISREVNKLEDWLLTPEVLGFSSRLKENEYYQQAARNGSENNATYTEYAQKNWAKDKAYLRDVRRFLQTMLEDNYANKNFLRLAIVHLYHLEGNYSEAKSYLVDINVVNEKAWQVQLEIERLVSLVHLNDIKEPETQEQIYAGLKRLEQQGQLPISAQRPEEGGIEVEAAEMSDDISEVLLLISREYKKKGDLLTAGLLHQKADILINEYDGTDGGSGFGYKQIAYFDRYASPATMDSLIDFKKRLTKTEFEHYITPQNWAADDFYKDLKATILIRENKYSEALAVFNTMPDDFWQKNYEFKEYLPKKSVLNAGTLLPGESGPTTTYAYPSKKLVLEDIIRQQEILAATPDPKKKANTYFLLGNAYYNISFYGKAWMLFSYGNSASEVYSNADDTRWHNWAFFSLYPNSVKYGNSYYRLSDAMNMYYRAYNYAGTNRELATKALLMLTYCDHLVNREPYAEEVYYSKYLQILRANYGNTATYRVSKTYCPDVSGFVGGN